MPKGTIVTPDLDFYQPHIEDDVPYLMDGVVNVQM